MESEISYTSPKNLFPHLQSGRQLDYLFPKWKSTSLVNKIQGIKGVHSCPRATKTNYHNLGDLKQRNWFSGLMEAKSTPWGFWGASVNTLRLKSRCWWDHVLSKGSKKDLIWLVHSRIPKDRIVTGSCSTKIYTGNKQVNNSEDSGLCFILW